MIELTNDQARARDKLVAWWKDKNLRATPFKLYGYAGTGKTTVVEHLLKALNMDPDRVALLAPTGKAARVLARRTGWPTSTIHKALYRPRQSSQVQVLRDQMKEDVGQDALEKLGRELEKEDKIISFEFTGGLENYSLIVVDEVSMVNERVAKDLVIVGIPLLLLGDPGQLPPVKARAGFMNVEPAITLTEIVRQDAGSSILKAADIVRRGDTLPNEVDWGAFKRVKPRELSDKEYASYDVVLCGTHRVRQAFNRRLREQIQGLRGDFPLPVIGDRLVCRKNNYDTGIMNGQTLKADGDARIFNDLSCLLAIVDEDGKKANVMSSRRRFESHYKRGVSVFLVEDSIELDYAYALTVHSAQGSEWNRIVVLNDWPGHDHARWLYTAITRGAKEVVLVG